VFAGRDRIVQLVPAHHLYGFLFTVLLPERLGVPVVDLRAAGAGTLARTLGPGDLVVGHPAMLALLVRMLPSLPPGIVVTSSTAPLPRATADALRARGATAVHEIYGSSETAGIASRSTPDAGFVLLPRWRQGGAGEAASIIAVATGEELPLPDRVAWLGNGALELQGRKDGAVQVAGINVFPAAIAERIATCPGVAECAVRLDTALAEPRLKAFVVPAEGHAATLAAALERWSRETLAEAERPVRFDIGPLLPRNELGKLVDWARAG
jgi:4-coumarate--CoA ligase